MSSSQARTRHPRQPPGRPIPRLITSMDWAKGGEGLRHARCPATPCRSSAQARSCWWSTRRTTSHQLLARTMRSRVSVPVSSARSVRTSSIVVPTATPHNGYTESFISLLELLDDQRFARNIVPDEKAANQVMIRLGASFLVDAEDSRRCPAPAAGARGQLHGRGVDPTEAERLLRQPVTWTPRRPGSTSAPGSSTNCSETPLLIACSLRVHAEEHCASLTGSGTTQGPDPIAERILRKAILRVE